MDYVNSSGTFFRQKSTQKAPRPKVAFAPAQSLSSVKTGLRRSAATWSEVLDFVAVSSAFETAFTFEAISHSPKPPRF
jgi:hypothetical protein